MKYRLLLPGLVALALLFASCAPPPPLRDDSLLKDDSVLVSTDEDCFAPCWREITPGETAWRDALTILEDTLEFEEVQTQQAEEGDAVGALFKPKDGTQCCQVVAQDGKTVSLIFLRTSPDHTIGELFEVHGEPDYAVTTPYTDTEAIINLIYTDIPMIIFAFIGGAEAEVSATNEIIGVLYTTPADMDLFMETNSLHLWKGYAPYATYSGEEGSSFDVTPSVEVTPQTEG